MSAGIAAPAQASSPNAETAPTELKISTQAIDWGNVLAQYNSIVECQFYLVTKWRPKYPSWSLGCEHNPAGTWVIQRYVA